MEDIFDEELNQVQVNKSEQKSANKDLTESIVSQVIKSVPKSESKKLIESNGSQNQIKEKTPNKNKDTLTEQNLISDISEQFQTY